MVFGRIIGWVILLFSIVMASGDVVMALGSIKYNGLATADLWTFLSGQNPNNFIIQQDEDKINLLTSILSMPAWSILGPSSILMLYLFRTRRPHLRVSSHIN